MKHALVNLGQGMTKSIYIYIGYCGMQNTLKDLGQRIIKTLENLVERILKNIFGKMG